MRLRVRGHLVATTAFALLCGVSTGFAQDSCSAYPTAKMDKIEVDRCRGRVRRGAGAKEGVALRLRHQDPDQRVLAGRRGRREERGRQVQHRRRRAGGQGRELDDRAAQPGPDGAVAEARRAASVAAVRTPIWCRWSRRRAPPTSRPSSSTTRGRKGASTYVGTDQVSIGAKAAAFLQRDLSGRRQGRPDRGRGRLAQRPAAHPGLQGGAGEVSQARTGRQPARQLGSPDGPQRHRQHPAPDTRTRRHLCQQ